MPEISNLATICGSVFAAGAAGASWMTVIRSQREARERRQPYLLASAVPVFAAKPSDRIILFTVINEGFGMARNSAFILAAETKEYVANPLGPGFLRYQEKAQARSHMQIREAIRAIVMCRDRAGRTWAWDLEGRARSYDGKRFDPTRDYGFFWSDFYGENLSSWRRAKSTVTMSA